MRILVTNDDGYASEGLKVLVAVLRERHEVWVVAPVANRSGVSHGITMDDSLCFYREGERDFTCSGLPADCALNGYRSIMPYQPDALVSGINRGANLGTDLLYSGTAAAARQAVINGIPGIALSLVSKTDEYRWEPLARFALTNLETLVSLCSRDIFVNVNAPSAQAFRGARLTGLSRREYRDTIVMREGPDGSRQGVFQGGAISTEGDGLSDWDAVESGYVSVTRVLAQPVVAPWGNDIPSFTV